MKVSESKFIESIKDLATSILKKHPDCIQAHSIISLCNVVDCSNSIITRGQTHVETSDTSLSFEEAVREQHTTISNE